MCVRVSVRRRAAGSGPCRWRGGLSARCRGNLLAVDCRPSQTGIRTYRVWTHQTQRYHRPLMSDPRADHRYVTGRGQAHRLLAEPLGSLKSARLCHHSYGGRHFMLSLLSFSLLLGKGGEGKRRKTPSAHWPAGFFCVSPRPGGRQPCHHEKSGLDALSTTPVREFTRRG